MSTPDPSASTASEAPEKKEPPKRPDTKPASNKSVPNLQSTWRNRGESDLNDRKDLHPLGPNSERGFGRGTHVRGRGMPHPVRERDKRDERDNPNQRRAMNEFVRRDEYHGDEFSSHDSRRPILSRPEKGPPDGVQARGNDENFSSLPARKLAGSSFPSQPQSRRRPVDDPVVRRMSRNSDVSDTSVHSPAETLPKVTEEDLKSVVWKTGVKRFSRDALVAFRKFPNLQQKPEWLPSFLCRDDPIEACVGHRPSKDSRQHARIPQRGDRVLSRTSADKADSQPPDRGFTSRGGIESSAHDDSPWSSSAAPSARFDKVKEQFQKEREAFLRERQQQQQQVRGALKPQATDSIQLSDDSAADKAELSLQGDYSTGSYRESAVGAGAGAEQANPSEAEAAPPLLPECSKLPSPPSKPPVGSTEKSRPSCGSEEATNRRASSSDQASLDECLAPSSPRDGLSSNLPHKAEPMTECSSSQPGTSLRSALRDAKEQAAKLTSKGEGLDRSSPVDEGAPDTSMPVQLTDPVTAAPVEAELRVSILPQLGGFGSTGIGTSTSAKTVEAPDGTVTVMHPLDPAELFRMDVDKQSQQLPHGPPQDGGPVLGSTSRIFETSLLRELLGSDQGADSDSAQNASSPVAWTSPGQPPEVAGGHRAAPSRALSRWFSLQAAPEPSEDDSGEMFFTDFLRNAKDTEAPSTSPPLSHNPSHQHAFSSANLNRPQGPGSDAFNALFGPFTPSLSLAPTSFPHNPAKAERPSSANGPGRPIPFGGDWDSDRRSPPAIGTPKDLLRDLPSSPLISSLSGPIGLAALPNEPPQGSAFSVLHLGSDQSTPYVIPYPGPRPTGPIGHSRHRGSSSKVAAGQGQGPASATAAVAPEGSALSVLHLELDQNTPYVVPPQGPIRWPTGPIGHGRPRHLSSNAAAGQGERPDSPTAAVMHTPSRSSAPAPTQAQVSSLGVGLGADAALLGVLQGRPSGKLLGFPSQPSLSPQLDGRSDHRSSEDGKGHVGGPELLSKLFEAADNAPVQSLPRPPPTKALTLEDVERSQVLHTIHAATSTGNSEALAPTAMASMTGSVASWFKSLPDTLPTPREIEPSTVTTPFLPSRHLPSPHVTDSVSFRPTNHDAAFPFANQSMSTNQRQPPPELPPDLLDKRFPSDPSLQSLDPSLREMFRPAPPLMPFPVARDSPTMPWPMGGLYGPPPSRGPMRPVDPREPMGPMHRPGMSLGPPEPFPEAPWIPGPMGPMGPAIPGMPFTPGFGFPIGPEQHPFRPAGLFDQPMGRLQQGPVPPMQVKLPQFAPAMGMAMGMGTAMGTGGPMGPFPPGFPGEGMRPIGGSIPSGPGFNQLGQAQGLLGPPMRPPLDAWPGEMPGQSPPPAASGGNLLDKLFDADVDVPLRPMPNQMRSLTELEAKIGPRT